MRSMTLHVLIWEILISRMHTPATHSTAVQTAHTGARPNPGCGTLAAGTPEPHEEVAQHGTLKETHGYDDDDDDDDFSFIL